MSRIDLPARSRILVVALRRLGDVLLTTPLIRSLRRAWPDATIDALVFADTAGILAGNPDLNGVVTMKSPTPAAQGLALAARLWRKYDLAISTQSGDRPALFALLAGRKSVAPLEQNSGGALKRVFLHRSVDQADGIHRVEQMLQLADLIGIARVPEIVLPQARDVTLPGGEYAVIHASPMYRYKQWTVSGWRDVAARLSERGLSVIATGGPSDGRYLDEVWNGVKVRRLDGQLDWPQLGALLKNARVYVGPDTSVTHLAAAAGCPVIALYGPTDPRLWGPWPAAGLNESWAASSAVQKRGNVWLVQNPLPCMPCQLEGCERRRDSYSACLDELTPQRVLAAIDQALGVSGG